MNDQKRAGELLIPKIHLSVLFGPREEIVQDVVFHQERWFYKKYPLKSTDTIYITCTFDRNSLAPKIIVLYFIAYMSHQVQDTCSPKSTPHSDSFQEFSASF